MHGSEEQRERASLSPGPDAWETSLPGCVALVWGLPGQPGQSWPEVVSPQLQLGCPPCSFLGWRSGTRRR